MTAPRNASAEIGQRRAYTFQGEKYPSVTTILKLGRPKEWLGAWAAKMVAETAVNTIDEWYDPEWQTTTPDDAIRFLKGSPWRKRDAAAAHGSSTHDALEALARGDAIPDFVELEQWRDMYRPAILESEAQVVNTSVGYAGSLDLIAEVYGRRLLIDLKTSKRYDGQRRPKNVDRDWCLQLAAYRYAERIFEDDRFWSMPEVEGAAVLWVPSDAPDEWAFLEVPAGAAEWRAFLAAKDTHDDYRAFEKLSLGELVLPQVQGEAA